MPLDFLVGSTANDEERARTATTAVSDIQVRIASLLGRIVQERWGVRQGASTWLGVARGRYDAKASITRRTSSPFLKSHFRRFRPSSSFSPVTTTSHRRGKRPAV